MRQALIVDDESDSRAFVQAILEPEGWAVAEAEDGVSALERIRELRPELIILDVLMPKKSGFDVYAELATAAAETEAKIIMLTGVADRTEFRFNAGQMGEYFGKEPDAYVEKPADPEAFKRVVRRVAG